MSPLTPVPADVVHSHIFGRTRLLLLLSLSGLFLVCLSFAWTTRDAMAHLPFLQGKGQGILGGQKTLVDQRPWQTAQALAPLAVSAEEAEYAREALRLADHEVDQAFDSALRVASEQAQHRVLTGEASALSQKVASLQQVVVQDQALVDSLTSKSASPAIAVKGAPQPEAAGDGLEVAKAQFGLDSDEMADAQRDLDRASGDNRAEIQSELTAHQAAMHKYNNQLNSAAQVAVLSARQHGTLAGRLKAWFDQRDRYQLIQQALGQAQSDVVSLTTDHNDLEAKANARAAAKVGEGSAGKLAELQGRREQRQLLSIFDDRIQTEQQLATLYGKWSAQVLLQHRIVLHLILQSSALIALIFIGMILSDALVRRVMDDPALDRKRMHTIRTILEVSVQALGVLLILFVLFGAPQQISTVLGLATAGITIALQDFILAFFGWFALMGKNGMRLGDWVEINGVGGEVTEIGMIYTTLLETGGLADKGHPTGRRITFINSFAIRGQFFNFSTNGQWMWDEITVPVPASSNTQEIIESIQKAVVEETGENAGVAEQEWKRGTRGDGLSRFSATPVVNLRPSGSNIDIQVRYVTRASERFDLRNRLYQHVVDLLQKQESPFPTERAREVGNK
ncbi:MAG: mechanosensitive ion channel family protein [Terracidiphilus sp.]